MKYWIPITVPYANEIIRVTVNLYQSLDIKGAHKLYFTD